MSDISKKDLVKIRGFFPEDAPFICRSWLLGLYYGSDFYNAMSKDTFMSYYSRAVNVVLSMYPATDVKIACLVEDPTVILGYSVGAPNTIHWVYVKKEWRGIGIARDLMPKEEKVIATHGTKAGLAIVKKRGWAYNPFLFA